jgi:hypothetical protein
MWQIPIFTPGLKKRKSYAAFSVNLKSSTGSLILCRLLINALSVKSSTGNQVTGNLTNQDLASQNVPTSLLTQDNFRFARHPLRDHQAPTNPAGRQVQGASLRVSDCA